MARELDCALLIDEFYSHYVWTRTPGHGGRWRRAARYVEDVDRDPVVLFDGLTKNWRYPGWRVTWTVGPQPVIEAVASAARSSTAAAASRCSARRSRCSRPSVVAAETRGDPRRRSARSARIMLRRAARGWASGSTCEPEGTFYVWGDVAGLPAAAQRRHGASSAPRWSDKVISVPGEFFDVNPGKRRSGRPSRFRHYVRFSFGPDEATVVEGVRADSGRWCREYR